MLLAGIQKRIYLHGVKKHLDTRFRGYDGKHAE